MQVFPIYTDHYSMDEETVRDHSWTKIVLILLVWEIDLFE